MTRSRTGRAPDGEDPRSNRRRDARSADRRRSGAPDAPVGKRVTPKSDDTDRHASRRSRGVQIAAIAFAILLVIAMAVGCAKYDGDKAAFCAKLDDAPSFMQLSAKVNSGSDAEAVATMKGAAAEFRTLERLAPRSIRATVAALGDAAERIEAHLGSGSGAPQLVTLQNDDGSTTQIPITTSPSQARLGVFYDEMQNHHGTATAVYSLMSYGRDDCGITEHEVDLGMFGYGPSDGSGPGFGGDGSVTVPGLQPPGRSPGQDPATVTPPPGLESPSDGGPGSATTVPGAVLVPPATATR